jgi:hypothetical protein
MVEGHIRNTIREDGMPLSPHGDRESSLASILLAFIAIALCLPGNG